MKTSQLNPWITQTQKPSETKYCKNLDNIAKSLIQKMKSSVVCQTTAGRNKEVKKDIEESLNKEETDIREQSARDSGKLKKIKSSKNTKRKTKGSKEKLSQKSLFKNSSSVKDLHINNKLFATKFKIDKAKIENLTQKFKKVDESQANVPESPMSRANIEMSQLNIQKISTTEFEKQIQPSLIQSSMNESDLATIKQQFESIYTTQDIELKTDAVRTQDSRVPIKGSGLLKKKSVKKKIDKKMKLNLKQNNSNIKRSKKRVSRSNKRSKSKRKSPTVNDTLQSNVSKK